MIVAGGWRRRTDSGLKRLIICGRKLHPRISRYLILISKQLIVTAQGIFPSQLLTTYI